MGLFGRETGIGQGLVIKEHLWFADHGAPHGDALALATGKLAWLAIEQIGEADSFGRALHAFLPLGAANPATFNA